MTLKKMDDYGAQNLCYYILRRAYEDYYSCCQLPKKLPKRQHVSEKRQKTFKKRAGRRLMTDHEYHLFVMRLERYRRAKKEELLGFFHSRWYATLIELDKDAAREEADRIISMIEWKRKNGVTLFDKKFMHNGFEIND